MGSKVISFRFDNDKLALLQQHRVRGESDNQTAMRLLLGVLGVEVKQSSRHAVDIVDTIRSEIKESLADGDIKDAIATSYKAVMGNFNGLLSEIESLKKLQSSPPAAAAAADDQLPIPCSQLPDIEKSTIENIRTTLKRKAIQSVSNDQIRAAFKDAGWDGNNFNEIKKDILAILSGDKK